MEWGRYLFWMKPMDINAKRNRVIKGRWRAGPALKGFCAILFYTLLSGVSFINTTAANPHGFTNHAFINTNAANPNGSITNSALTRLLPPSKRTWEVMESAIPETYFISNEYNTIYLGYDPTATRNSVNVASTHNFAKIVVNKTGMQANNSAYRFSKNSAAKANSTVKSGAIIVSSAREQVELESGCLAGGAGGCLIQLNAALTPP